MLRITGDEIIEGIVHKVCPSCGELKPLDGFGLRTSTKTGATMSQSWCKECRRVAARKKS